MVDCLLGDSSTLSLICLMWRSRELRNVTFCRRFHSSLRSDASLRDCSTWCALHRTLLRVPLSSSVEILRTLGIPVVVLLVLSPIKLTFSIIKKRDVTP